MSKQEFNLKNTIKLHEAICAKEINLDKINKLIEKGADLNAPIKSKNYGTPLPALFAAVSRDNLELVKLLLVKGADVNKVIIGNSSLLEWAYAVTYRSTVPVYQNTKKIFEEILKNPKFETINLGLLNLVITKKDLDFLKFLFDTGKIDLSQRDKKGNNILDKVNKYIDKNTSKLMDVRDLLIKKGAVASKNSAKLNIDQDDENKEDKIKKQDNNILKEKKSSFDDEVTKEVFPGESDHYSFVNQDEAKLSGNTDINNSDSEY